MHIGFACPNPNSTYWTLIAYGVRSAVRALDAELTMIPAWKYRDQVNAIAQMIVHQVDVLILGPFGTDILIPVLDPIIKSGIPVLTVGVHLPNSPTVCEIYPDNVAAASLAATYIVERLSGRGKVLYLQAPDRMPENIERRAGFQQ